MKLLFATTVRTPVLNNVDGLTYTSKSQSKTAATVSLSSSVVPKDIKGLTTKCNPTYCVCCNPQTCLAGLALAFKI